MFLGPERDAGTEGWAVKFTWDLELQDDGTVMVRHPFWQYYQRPGYPHPVEWPLATFKTDLQAAHTARLAEYGGRIGEDKDWPMLVTGATSLNAFHIEAGNTTHANGPPEPPPPVHCGLVYNNANLLADCETLLEARDALRGTGTLNWSVDTAIGSWDGVTVDGTPQRVTKLELANKSLTGTIPSVLTKLKLTTLKLAGNSLTGCIPPALREVTTNDLASLNLPDCPE